MNKLKESAERVRSRDGTSNQTENPHVGDQFNDSHPKGSVRKSKSLWSSQIQAERFLDTHVAAPLPRPPHNAPQCVSTRRGGGRVGQHGRRPGGPRLLPVQRAGGSGPLPEPGRYQPLIHMQNKQMQTKSHSAPTERFRIKLILSPVPLLFTRPSRLIASKRLRESTCWW